MSVFSELLTYSLWRGSVAAVEECEAIRFSWLFSGNNHTQHDFEVNVFCADSQVCDYGFSLKIWAEVLATWCIFDPGSLALQLALVVSMFDPAAHCCSSIENMLVFE